MRDLANERKRFGYRRLFVLLRQEGEPSGINRMAREKAWVLARIAEKPDLTLRALLKELADRGLVGGVIMRFGVFSSIEVVTFEKKPARPSEQDRPDVAKRRERWKARQATIDPRRLVFIDDTWAKTNMTGSHGRCARGARLVAKAPFGKWRTLTFLAALRCDRLTAPCVIDGPINGASFRAYVEQVLVPILAPDDIVVMGNLGSHKGRRHSLRHSRRQSQALLPARLLARPQSDRAGLRENDDPAAQGRSSNGRFEATCENHRPHPAFG